MFKSENKNRRCYRLIDPCLFAGVPGALTVPPFRYELAATTEVGVAEEADLGVPKMDARLNLRPDVAEEPFELLR